MAVVTTRHIPARVLLATLCSLALAGCGDAAAPQATSPSPAPSTTAAPTGTSPITIDSDGQYPTVEVTTASGRVVWSPRYYPIPCPARPPGSPPAILRPGTPITAHQVWNLTTCGDGGCTGARLAPGTYVARGYSDTVGLGQPVTVNVR